MTRCDTREDLPGAVCFTQSVGNNKKFWIHPSAVGAVAEDTYWTAEEPKDSCEVILRTGYTFFVEGTVKEVLEKLGWQ